MKKHTTYILYSTNIGKYYVGYTSQKVEERIRKHNSAHRGFTGRTNDWIVIYSISFNDRNEAISLERKIKKRGAKRYLEGLQISRSKD